MPSSAPEDRAELLELIELQSDRLARLVTNLLDMTRLEAGALELRPTTVSFRDLVDEALALLGGIVTPGSREGRRAGGPAPAAPRSRPDEPGPGQRARERRAHLPRGQRHPRRRRGARPATRRWSRSQWRDDGPGIARRGPRKRLRDVQPERRRWPGRPRPGHRQGLRRGARWAHLDRHRRGARRPDRLHRSRRRPSSRRRSEGPP